MGTKMKGLLKGLRYISQIFESEDEEPEMQIGYPTDVKHVAHIGWDGPSVSSNPSWMNEFRSASAPLNPGHDGAASPKYGPDSPKRNSRRNHSADSITREGSEGSRHRRNKGGSSTAAANGGNDLPAIPKQARRKKTKGGSGGSTRSSRSKATASEEMGGQQITTPAAALTEKERL
ncbi:CRIB domain-containing protein [Dioscorea alata]|uniref:CRIB domain-containing protein n=1 Tax=Dioscorea alata TaxID=55571 RepID=A0ACB7V8P1_DIOAL|nr:CRIB domain-containing protein [Dioscorea alata]